MLPYEPKLLAKYPAELYDIDFDDASLEARGRASEQMRNEQLEFKDKDVEMNVSTLVIQMSFSLVLMPVWVATLTERDDDLRTALVNGQSGRVALEKPEERTLSECYAAKVADAGVAHHGCICTDTAAISDIALRRA